MYVEAARLLKDVFPFVNTDDVVHNFELEKPTNKTSQRLIIMRMLGTTCAFWHDSRLKPPFWYNVAKDIALIQHLLLSWIACFLSFARAWARGKRLAIATELGRRPCSSTAGEENITIFCIRDALPCTAALYTLVILRCGFSSLCFIKCSSIIVVVWTSSGSAVLPFPSGL